MKLEKRNTKYYSDEDSYIANGNYLYLPRKNRDGKDMVETYKALGFDILDTSKTLEVKADKGTYSAYKDQCMFNRPDMLKSYRSVVVNERDEVILTIYTKRFGMTAYEYECEETI